MRARHLTIKYPNIIWYVHTMEYYLAIKSNDKPIQATGWMNLKDMLSERSQIQKTTYCIIPFIEYVRTRQSIETESRLVCLGVGVKTGNDCKCT